MGQGETTDEAARPSEPPVTETPTPAGNGQGDVVAVDFGGVGPAGPEAA